MSDEEQGNDLIEGSVEAVMSKVNSLLGDAERASSFGEAIRTAIIIKLAETMTSDMYEAAYIGVEAGMLLTREQMADEDTDVPEIQRFAEMVQAAVNMGPDVMLHVVGHVFLQFAEYRITHPCIHVDENDDSLDGPAEPHIDLEMVGAWTESVDG